MAWNDGLEGVALEIARTNASPLRVMAGPGTGKSFAMKRRVARLLEDGIQASKILAVTFTRNAAASLVTDLRELNIDGCEEIRASTLHGFCFSLLSQEAVFEYLGRQPRPLVTYTSHSVLKFEAEPMLHDLSLVRNFGGSRASTKRIRAFEAAWSRLQSDEPGWPNDDLDNAFHHALIDWMRFHKCMLIGELVPEALRFLRNNPESRFLTMYDHIIVDEYQDLNRAEQELIDQLSANGNIAIVGDVDQSIYSFRHAHPEGIVEFNLAHDPTHDEELLECRRCPTTVVAMADRLIRENHQPDNRIRLHPFANNPEGEVYILQWPTIEEEATGLARYAHHLIEEYDYAPGDILILSPRKHIGHAVRDALRDLEVPVHSFYHEETMEPFESQESLVLLTLLCNPDDLVALRWWLGVGSPTWRKGQYSRLRTYCSANGTDLRETLDRISRGRLNVPHTNQLADRYRLLNRKIEGLRNNDIPALIDALFPAGPTWSIPLRSAAIRAADEIEEIDELLSAIRVAITQPEIPEDNNFARIMSLHKSKGLTSKVVLLAGCMEGLMPTIDRELPESEQLRSVTEQRRLFYVAITRCREILVISSSSTLDTRVAHTIGAQVRPGGRTIASRFINEMGNIAPATIRGSDWVQANFV